MGGRPWTRKLLLSTAIAVVGLWQAGPAAGGHTPLPTCGTPPCIVSFTVDGAAPPSTVSVSLTPSAELLNVGLLNDPAGPPPETDDLTGAIGTANVINLRLNVGTFDPRVVAVAANVDAVVTTLGSVAGNIVELTVRPAATSWSFTACGPSGCNFGPASVANVDYGGAVLAAIVNPSPPTGLPAEDAAFFSLFLAAARGSWVGTNAQQFAFPTYDPSAEALTVSVGAPHFKSNGTTVNSGFFKAFVPTAILTDVFGLAGTSSVTGAITVSQTSDGVSTPVSATVSAVSGGVLIDIPSVTYSSPTFSVAPNADLAVSHVVTNPVPVGRLATFTVEVRNAGPGSARDVALSEALPSGVTLVSASSTQGSCSLAPTTLCSLGALAAGATATATFVVRTADVGDLSAIATVFGARPDPSTANNTSVARTSVGFISADVGLTATGGAATAAVGDTLTYVLTVRNHGPWSADDTGLTVVVPTGAEVVSASPSSGSCTGAVRCAFGTLAAGQTAVVTLVLRVTGAGGLVTRAEAGSVYADPSMTNQRVELRTDVAAPTPPAAAPVPPARTPPARRAKPTAINGTAGNDVLRGTPRADRIVGGRGRDVIRAGAGDDIVLVRDGERDVVDCGAGRDRVLADRRDVLRGCEVVSRR